MDAETILLAKKFSGGADVSAAKAYRDAAQAAATQAAQAAASVPNNVGTTLTTIQGNVTQLQSNINGLETSLQEAVTELEEEISGIETGTISVEGNVGDVLRVGQNGTVIAGDRPITKLMEAMVPQDITHEDSGIIWIANDDDMICGFVINEDMTGKTIDSYNHDKYLLTLSNNVRFITDGKVQSRTVVIDTDYVNGSSEDRNKRSGYMYYTVPYADAHQVCVTIEINAAGSANTDLNYGTSTKSDQIFPAGAVVGLGKRYQNGLNTDHVRAVSVVLLDDTFRYGTMIRLWKA